MKPKRNSWIELTMKALTERPISICIVEPPPDVLRDVLRVCTRHDAGQRVVFIPAESKLGRQLRDQGQKGEDGGPS